jgi:hypothetical protein
VPKKKKSKQQNKTKSKPKNLPRRKTSIPKPAQTNTFSYKKLVAGFGSVLSIFLAVVSFYSFYPKISISPMGVTSSKSALSTQFQIENTGFFTINNLHVTSIINKAVIGPESYHNYILNSVNSPNFRVFELKPGEKDTLPLSKSARTTADISSADIQWEISYKIAKLPFLGVFHFSQRFKSITNETGEVIWNPVTLD